MYTFIIPRNYRGLFIRRLELVIANNSYYLTQNQSKLNTCAQFERLATNTLPKVSIVSANRLLHVVL